MIFRTNSAEQTIELGTRIGEKLRPGDILAMRGTLGAGKTTFTKGVARGLGITDTVTSPTFTLVSEYQGRLPLFHIDTYRLDGPDDFMDLGVEELLNGQGVCVIEWSEKIQDILPADHIVITLGYDGDGRRVTIQHWPYEDVIL